MGLGMSTIAKAVNNLNSEGGNSKGSNSSSNNYSNQSDKQLKNSKSSYEKLLSEHKSKLADFNSNPMGKSDPNKLKEAMKGGPNAVRKFLQGRVESLGKQIKKQEGELKKINEEYKRRDNANY